MRIDLAPVAAAVVLLSSPPTAALEKRSVPFDDARLDSWSTGSTCQVSYYNICTGWLWCWYDLEEQERLGIVVDSCCGPAEAAVLCQSRHFLCSAPPAGYGYTGTIGVHNVDPNDCPVEPAMYSQPYLPTDITNGFAVVNWSCVPVPSRFAIIITMINPFGGFPTTIATDHPAEGPTGPQACGLCYPSNRTIHSFRFGRSSTPLCPGIKFNDGVCDAELAWDVDFACSVSVEESSWGKIKGLYR